MYFAYDSLTTKEARIMGLKPIYPVHPIEKSPVAQFLSLVGKPWKNGGKSRNPQGFPATEKLGKLSKKKLSKLGDRFEYHNYVFDLH